MSKKWTEEEVFAEMKRIQESIPKALTDFVVRQEKITPDMEFVMEQALKDPKFPEEKKPKIKMLLDTGMFSRTVNTENPKIAKMIDSWVNKEIEKSRKAGRLPPKPKKNGANRLRKGADRGEDRAEEEGVGG